MGIKRSQPIKTLEAAKGRWDEILPAWGLRITNNKHVQCKLCDRKGSSGMRITERSGDCSYICVCGSGSAINLIMEMTGLPFADIAKQIDQIIGNEPDRLTMQPRLKGVPKKTAANLKHINGTWTEYYLKERGVINLPTMSVNHCTSVPFFNDEGKREGDYEAMVATVTDAQTIEILQYHYTYLVGSKKFCRKVRNLTDIEYKIPVVRLMDATKSLGIAEGIETALRAHDMYDVPCWSTINSGFMKRFRAPLGVVKLYIFTDNDRSLTGHAAAFECARANLSAKNDVSEVIIMWPDELGDFADLDDKENICHWSSSK